ncbi:putative flagellin [Selenomonas ruminantium subsp. lactilytica TAM6421]|uniref:Flagellin n=1 Tax=Selenomonas ruminantium subsp. lactilytica (strain NBRC 103574 / TAM6421) TaxID=927704 RepID=I0GP84_SELRL|nr:flagellin [Selenomonas ruminantium]BAL82571.1 putative flagellin [Selenomonas ruminantium subsp. lactilytica TAM6421]
MSMVVKNNIPAVMTLGVLNKNSAALAKSLQQVSSGMKINSAADDNSGFAIAERMQVRIRSLDQADQNTQSGASMLKVAEGSVNSTIDILRTMKEKAINAANDTNTDTDRGIIQKELDQFIDQVDDNALITYNGKTLVDGSKMSKGDATRTALTNESLNSKTTGLTALVDLQNRNGENLNILTTDKLTVSYVIQGRNYSKEIDIDVNKTLNDVLVEAMEPYSSGSDNPQLRAAYDNYNSSVGVANSAYNSSVGAANSAYNSSVGAAASAYTLITTTGGTVSTATGETTLVAAMSMATSAITVNQDVYSRNLSRYNDASTNLASATPGSADYLDYSDQVSMYSTRLASYSAAISTDTSTYNALSTQLGSVIASAYTVYSTAESTAASTLAVAKAAATSTLNSAINAAVEALNGDLEAIGDLIPYQLTMKASNVVGQDAAGNDVYTADMGTALTITAAGAGDKYQLSGFTFNVTDIDGNIKKNVNSVLDNFTESVRALNKSEDNSITFQVDAKANQAIKIGLTDMRSEALGLKGANGETLSIATQKSANSAVNVLDNAIKKALDQQTDIGAISNRLGQTSANLRIARDNVQASESTIRDADMAKVMTEYTKNNVLLQASQSMLAQANQSGSSVLGLLS